MTMTIYLDDTFCVSFPFPGFLALTLATSFFPAPFLPPFPPPCPLPTPPFSPIAPSNHPPPPLISSPQPSQYDTHAPSSLPPTSAPRPSWAPARRQLSRTRPSARRAFSSLDCLLFGKVEVGRGLVGCFGLARF